MNSRGPAAAVLLAAAASAWAATGTSDATFPQRHPTFAKDIAPLVYAHCMPCHRIGQPSPFPLVSYDDVHAQGAAIAVSTQAGLMPPWRATQGPGFPALADDRRLTDRQIAAIAAWVSHGMPPGSPRDLPAPPTLSSSPWPLGMPNVTLTLPRPISLSAGDSDEYRNVVIPLDFPADVAISAIDYLPEAGSVLRHARFFAAPPDLVVSDADPLPGVGALLGSGSLENYGDRLLSAAGALVDLGAWTPGFARRMMPDGLARRLPARSVLIMQMHLRPGEIDAVESGRLGIYFSKPASRRFVQTLAVPPAFGIASGLSVPAGQRAFAFTDTFTLPIDVDVVGARADAQRLGHDMTLTATLPTRTTRGLLRIAAWDPDWPDSYFFAAPMHLPRGTTLKAEIVYDNSTGNARNIFTPPRRVVWGRISSGEIGALTLLIIEPAAAEAATLADAVARHLRDELLRK